MTANGLEIEARLSRPRFALKERVGLTLTVTNRRSEMVHVPHPIHSTALHLVLRGPDGSEQVVTPGAVVEPGTSPQIVYPGLPPGRNWVEDFDASEYLQLDRPGEYALTLEYEWAEDGRWKSEPLPLTVAPAAGTAWVAAPPEAARLGWPCVLWVEREGERGRFLFWTGVEPPLRGAVQVAEGSHEARPVLSATEPGKTWTETWAAWVQGGELYRTYFGQGLFPHLPPERVPLEGAQPIRVVEPLLAEFSPSARPRCTAGVLDAKALHLVELGPDGSAAARGKVVLPGRPEAAWATHQAKRGRAFAFALQRGENIAVAAVRAPYGRPPGALEQWLEVAGRFLGGDVRASADGTQTFAGVLAARQQAWARLTFRAPEPGKQAEPSLAAIDFGADARIRRVRLGPDGQMHLLVEHAETLHYVPPGSAKPSWSDSRLGRHARFVDLALPPGIPPALVVYDDERGPSLLPLR
ncbi:MAG TPA: hypothetical protein VKB92_04180 [Myxococcales bacterium]|nr:hypothetical protein [Myxococcales bacterium]